MSNLARVNVNKVENVKTNKIYYEIDISDSYNYGSIDIEEEEIPETDIDALQYLIDYGPDESENITDLIDSLIEYEKGLFINDIWYDWNEVKHLFQTNKN